METLTQLVLNAFFDRWPALQNNPLELAARLQRRRQATLNRPPRAWCVALRASDTRLQPLYAAMDDPDAFQHRQPHTVHVTASLIRRLIAPVYIHPPGEPWTLVAARLGVHEESLRRDMKLGRFSVHHIPPFSRKPGSPGRGKPVPLIYRDGPLNPCADNKAAPDRIWGDLWPFHGESVPDDFAQPLERHPRMRPYRRSAPWDVRFRGWTFTCPACRKQVEMIFLPLPVPTTEAYLRLTPGHPELDAPPTPPCTFACVRCHQVRYLTRTSDDGWSEFVAYLTAGLLYGPEVPKPATWNQRRRAYRPAPRRSSARSMPAVSSTEVACAIALQDSV